jgi:hypothetical protein
MLTSQRFDPNSKYRVLSHRGISVPGPVNHINQGEEVPTDLLTPATMFGLFVMGDIEPIPPATSAPIPAPPDEDDDNDFTPPAAALKPIRRVRRAGRQAR